MYWYINFVIFIFVFSLNINIIDSSPSVPSGLSKKAERSYERAMRNIQDEKVRIQKELDEIELNRKNFEQESNKVQGLVDNDDLIRFNVRGRTIVTRRKTLLKVPNSTLAKSFDGSSEPLLYPNSDGTYFLDYNPVIFTRLLDQLRMFKPNKTILFSPPLSSTLIKPYNRMLEEFGLPLPKQSPNDIISLNVGGEKIVTLRKTLTSVPNSKLAQLISSTKGTKYDQLGQPFLDYNPKLFQHLLDQLRQGKNLTAPSGEDKNAYESMLTDLGLKNNVSSTITTTTTTTNAKQTKFSATTKPTISAPKNKLHKQQPKKQKTTSMKPLTSTSKTPANKKGNSKNTDEYQRTTTKVEKNVPDKTEATTLTTTVINTSSMKDKTSTINGALQTTTDRARATTDPTSQVTTAVETTTIAPNHNSSTVTNNHTEAATAASETTEDETTLKSIDEVTAASETTEDETTLKPIDEVTAASETTEDETTLKPIDEVTAASETTEDETTLKSIDEVTAASETTEDETTLKSIDEATAASETTEDETTLKSIDEVTAASEITEDETTLKSIDGDNDTSTDTTTINSESSSSPETTTGTSVLASFENGNDINTPTESALDAAA
ncbi:unnamed protein product [Adineta steineri]|uniref:Potassium channel tetramerisation-type BTB domain-containing protein n=1 Tax=Adineta steineri TaxID=433720 RepID=A0A814M6T6_9BILA|nr:unnamed protein product [Adineta steineri]